MQQSGKSLQQQRDNDSLGACLFQLADSGKKPRKIQRPYVFQFRRVEVCICSRMSQILSRSAILVHYYSTSTRYSTWYLYCTFWRHQSAWISLCWMLDGGWRLTMIEDTSYIIWLPLFLTPLSYIFVLPLSLWLINRTENMVRFQSSVRCLIVLSTLTPSVSTFQTPSRSHASTGLHAQKQDLDLHALGKSAAAVMVAFVLSTSPVNADEYGRETEADTLFTGETTLVRIRSRCSVL